MDCGEAVTAHDAPPANPKRCLRSKTPCGTALQIANDRRENQTDRKNQKELAVRPIGVNIIPCVGKEDVAARMSRTVAGSR